MNVLTRVSTSGLGSTTALPHQLIHRRYHMVPQVSTFRRRRPPGVIRSGPVPGHRNAAVLPVSGLGGRGRGTVFLSTIFDPLSSNSVSLWPNRGWRDLIALTPCLHTGLTRCNAPSARGRTPQQTLEWTPLVRRIPFLQEGAYLSSWFYLCCPGRRARA